MSGQSVEIRTLSLDLQKGGAPPAYIYSLLYNMIFFESPFAVSLLGPLSLFGIY